MVYTNIVVKMSIKLMATDNSNNVVYLLFAIIFIHYYNSYAAKYIVYCRITITLVSPLARLISVIFMTLHILATFKIYYPIVNCALSGFLLAIKQSAIMKAHHCYPVAHFTSQIIPKSMQLLLLLS